MQVIKKPSGELMEIAIDGVLDNDSSIHFREEIESCMREGWHRIVVDLSGIDYVASAGVTALVASKAQLEQLNGLFGIHNASPPVEQVLKQMKCYDLLWCDPRTARRSPAAGSMTMALSASTRFVSEEGIDMMIYPLAEAAPMTCAMIGEAGLGWFDNRESTAPRPMMLQPDDLTIGLGTLREGFDEDRCPSGEILAVAGAVAQSPRSHGTLPDYSLDRDDYRPSVSWRYGVRCSGTMTTLIRFEASQRGERIGLSTLIHQAMQQTNFDIAACVMMADSAGVVGAQMRRYPRRQEQFNSDPYHVPEVRQWLSLSTERIYRRNLILAVGIACRSPSVERSGLSAMLRRLNQHRDLEGHFHAAVFPFQPMKKRTLKLRSSVQGLFESGSIQDVLHLLNDDRPLVGVGESEFYSGACWISSIGSVDKESRSP